MNKLQDYSSKIKDVHTKIEDLKTILKSEFFGIDDIIDNIAQLIEPWLTIPEAQIKPTIINLWGMTGTGKTSLVRRIAEILEEPLVQLDLGEYVQDRSFLQTFTINYFDLAGSPCIIMLDEIQNCRTIHDGGCEIDRAGLRGLWSLLSDGQLYWDSEDSDNHLIVKILNSILLYKVEKNIPLTYSEYAFLSSSDCFVNDDADSKNNSFEDSIFYNDVSFGLYGLEHKDIAKSIITDYRVDNGLRVSNDKIKKWKVNSNNQYRILSNKHIKDIFFRGKDSSNDDFSLSDIYKMLEDDYINTLYHMLEMVLNFGVQRELNYSQSLIFVAGNMDEVYTLAQSTDPDITPDDLYERTKKITVPDIKEALLQRFRPEQAARLGSNHILYPSFTEDVFRKIIGSRLDDIAEFYKDKFEIDLIFDKSVYDIIFKDGVIPSQGARPVLSTISSLVEAFIPSALYNLIDTSGNVPEGVELCVYAEKVGEQGVVKFFYGEKEVFSSKVNLNIESLRTPKYEDKSIYVAVHEAGHTVCSMLSSGSIPIKVTAFSSAATHAGVMDPGFHDKIMSKRDLQNKIISFLGGWAAEKYIFGEDLMCGGARADIAQVTYIASQMVRELGLMGCPIIKAKEFSTKEISISETEVDIQAIKDIVDECKNDALNIIEENEEIVLDITQILLEKPQVLSEDLEVILEKHNKKLPKIETVKDKFEQKMKKYNKLNQFKGGGKS